MALGPEHVASSTGDALGLEEGLWLPGRGARVNEDLRFQEGSGFVPQATVPWTHSDQ